jgi:hypothetical protein
MTPTLRALLTGLIDYAGLFPPAKLPLDQAIRNYAAYRRSADRWMLGRFIVPVTQLNELGHFGSLFRESPPFAFSFLGRGGNSEKEFFHNLAEDLTAIEDFREGFSSWVAVGSLEVKLPDEMCRPQDYEAICSLLQRTVEQIKADGSPGLSVFCEIGLAPSWRAALHTVHAALQHVRRIARSQPGGELQRGCVAGFKVRCGGLDAAAFPTTEQVAEVIASCQKHGIAFKATAGLHHPFRHYSNDVVAHMHGFVNVFAAAALASANDLEADTVRELLEDENPQHFLFEDTHLSWGNYRAGISQIERSRLLLATSFGSCSFDEPRDDLRALGLLP